MLLTTESADWAQLTNTPANGLADEWRALFAEVQPPAGPFVTPEFQTAWWDIFQPGGSPDLTTVREDDRLVGVVPLRIHDGTVGLVGDFEVCDYMDILAAPDHEEAVVDVLLDRLEALGSTSADLRGFASGSATLRLLPDKAVARGWQVEAQQEAVCPVVELPTDWESYTSGLRRKYRHEVRRKLRNLRDGKAVVDIEVIRDADAVRERLPDFLTMMTTSRGDKAEFMTEQMAAFFGVLVERLAPHGRIQLYFLLLDGKPVATVLCFVCCGQLMLYNSGYDPDYRSLSVGIASKVFCLREAIDEGRQAVNFLRGDEEYKFQMGAKAAPVTRLILTR